MKNIVTSISILFTTWFGSFNAAQIPMSNLSGLIASNQAPVVNQVAVASLPQVALVQNIELAQRELSLANRHANAGVNEIFKKNILLNLAYLNGNVTTKADLNWENVSQMKDFSFTLQPGETFAYHDHVLAKYRDSLKVTTKSHFSAAEGYLFSGFLYGDGVCHLASIINWAAQDAGLEVLRTKAHSIAKIPDVPDEYGVSIYTIAGQKESGVNNNLYITNNQTQPIEFRFSLVGETLIVEVVLITTVA